MKLKTNRTRCTFYGADDGALIIALLVYVLMPPVVLRTVILRNVYLQLFTVQRTLRRIRDAVNSRAESNGETGMREPKAEYTRINDGRHQGSACHLVFY